MRSTVYANAGDSLSVDEKKPNGLTWWFGHSAAYGSDRYLVGGDEVGVDAGG